MEDGNLEASFFELLESQLPALPSVIEKSCNFASLFSTEAALNLLEGCECEHVGDLANPMVVFVDQESHEGMSEAIQEVSRRIVLEYRVAYGREAARPDAIARLNEVGALLFYFIFHLLCFSLLILNPCLLFSSTVSRSPEC